MTDPFIAMMQDVITANLAAYDARAAFDAAVQDEIAKHAPGGRPDGAGARWSFGRCELSMRWHMDRRDETTGWTATLYDHNGYTVDVADDATVTGALRRAAGDARRKAGVARTAPCRDGMRQMATQIDAWLDGES